MHPPRLLRLTAPLLIGALALTACGSDKESSSGGEGGGSSKTLTIGVVAPLTGDLAAIGQGIKNGVDLAVKQANEKKTVKGVTLKLDAQDDTAKADVGATVAAKLVADSTVVGVVGPLNSSVAKSVAPVMAQANLTEISPSNSNVDLTGRGALATGGTQTRPYKSYFRVVATDDIQGPFAAQFAVKTLSKKTIAIVHDKKAYGQGLAEAFAKEAAKDGAKVLKTETINPGDKDFSATVTKLKVQKPDFLFYGGEYPEASLLTKQMKAGGLNIPLMGGDGVQADDYIKIGGAAAEGDYATALGAPPESLDSAKQFLTDYAAQSYADPIGPYGAYAYDAANVIINALAKAVADGKTGQELRDEVTKEVGDVDFTGATGSISFDQFGDTNSKVLTAYQVKGGKFVAAKTDTFK
ncbi:MAG: branched-chain amino acid ABC transporter substrate-binding protein [Actinobacteria bacterium]|nr:branched-chain amino acid ABC transporter substrate-binding protein [Actinomycetota bacterium]MCA1721301.1 branched-chain amino acid ABC transporter substrate-binding protein [Actinomycetota bacterium]